MNVKITEQDITYGPGFGVDELTAWMIAGDLTLKGYKKVSNAFCIVARIDRDDWVEVLAKEQCCSSDYFYNKHTSDIDDRYRDHYIRVYSKDKLVIAPRIYKKMSRF